MCDAKLLKEKILAESGCTKWGAAKKQWYITTSCIDSGEQCACNGHVLDEAFEWRNRITQQRIMLGIEGSEVMGMKVPDLKTQYKSSLLAVRADPKTAVASKTLVGLARAIEVLSKFEKENYSVHFTQKQYNRFIVLGFLKSRPSCKCADEQYGKPRKSPSGYFYGCRDFPNAGNCGVIINVDKQGNLLLDEERPPFRKRFRFEFGIPTLPSFPKYVFGTLCHPAPCDSNIARFCCGGVYFVKCTGAPTSNPTPNTIRVIDEQVDRKIVAVMKRERDAVIYVCNSSTTAVAPRGKMWMHCGPDTQEICDFASSLYAHYDPCEVYLVLNLFRQEALFIPK